jgi:HEPN domain-containing protein
MFHTDENIRLFRLIMSVAPAVRIYLLASTSTNHKTVSIFTSETLLGESIVHYHVLVLVRRTRETSYNSMQEKIETSCQPISPVTAIVMEVEQFGDWLATGHPFACHVKTKAVSYFEDLTVELVDASPIDPETLKIAKEAAHCQGLNKVNQFLAGADLFRIREQNKMAAFMLHQAAESALLTILKTSIGLTVNSHNLDKLVRYCLLVTSAVADIFKRNTENEKKQFQLLQRAYIDTRYRDDYYINTSDLLELTAKIRSLQEVLVSMGTPAFC